jgi:hypothetical protein
MAQTFVTGTGSGKIRMAGALATVSAGPPGHLGVGETTVTPTRMESEPVQGVAAIPRVLRARWLFGDPGYLLRVVTAGLAVPSGEDLGGHPVRSGAG